MGTFGRVSNTCQTHHAAESCTLFFYYWHRQNLGLFSRANTIKPRRYIFSPSNKPTSFMPSFLCASPALEI